MYVARMKWENVHYLHTAVRLVDLGWMMEHLSTLFYRLLMHMYPGEFYCTSYVCCYLYIVYINLYCAAKNI